MLVNVPIARSAGYLSVFPTMNAGSIEEFDGISLVEWTDDNKIKSLKEFGCNRNNYNPYQYGDQPRFRDEKANWF